MRQSVILFLLILVSCSHHVVLETKNCNNSAIWGSEVNHQSNIVLGRNFFNFSKSVYMFDIGINKKKIELSEVLQQNDLSCNQVETLFIEMKRDVSDLIISLIPFLSVKTIYLSGFYSNGFVMDEKTR